MKIVGALAKSRTQSVIYFCEYEENEINQDKLIELYKKCGYEGSDGKVSIVVVESSDNMTEDKRLVGVMFEDNKKIHSVLLDDYADLDFYLQELI
jgi:hypothetical protein